MQGMSDMLSHLEKNLDEIAAFCKNHLNNVLLPFWKRAVAT
jgi:membrane-bound acyltransferase YfiQ involved in biofilm formation